MIFWDYMIEEWEKPLLFRIYFRAFHCRERFSEYYLTWFYHRAKPYLYEFSILLRFKKEAFLVGYPITSDYYDLPILKEYYKDLTKL